MNKHNLYNREQLERLAELGSRLSETRKAQGITLDEVAKRTNIQPRLLQAIEVADLSLLPEPVYIQGFIRQYANAIGLDGLELAMAFPALSLAFSEPRSTSTWRGWSVAHLQPVHLYGIYFVLMISAVHTLSYWMNRSSDSVQLATLENLQRPQAQPIGPALPAKAFGSASSPAPAPIGNQKAVRIGLKLTSQSWVRVVVDGKADFEGVLLEGAQRTWMADKQVVLRAGNAGGVMVTFNDGKEQPLGDPGDVKEVAFPPEPRLANLPTRSHN
jgi:cytoskeletal protein RodZ